MCGIGKPKAKTKQVQKAWGSRKEERIGRKIKNRQTIRRETSEAGERDLRGEA